MNCGGTIRATANPSQKQLAPPLPRRVSILPHSRDTSEIPLVFGAVFRAENVDFGWNNRYFRYEPMLKTLSSRNTHGDVV
jgi:hypothetical protein